MLVQQNMGAFLGGMGTVPQASLPLLGGLGANLSGRGMEEPSAKVLRLDETGTYGHHTICIC